MVSTPYNFFLNQSRYNDQDFTHPSNHLAPFEYWTTSNQTISTLLMNFLRSSVFDLYTDESKPKFQSVNKKRVSDET